MQLVGSVQSLLRLYSAALAAEAARNYWRFLAYIVAAESLTRDGDIDLIFWTLSDEMILQSAIGETRQYETLDVPAAFIAGVDFNITWRDF